MDRNLTPPSSPPSLPSPQINDGKRTCFGLRLAAFLRCSSLSCPDILVQKKMEEEGPREGRKCRKNRKSNRKLQGPRRGGGGGFSRAPVDMEKVIVELLDFSLKGGRLEPVLMEDWDVCLSERLQPDVRAGIIGCTT